jgi:hypothetical protein
MACDAPTGGCVWVYGYARQWHLYRIRGTVLDSLLSSRFALNRWASNWQYMSTPAGTVIQNVAVNPNTTPKAMVFHLIPVSTVSPGKATLLSASNQMTYANRSSR